MSCDKDKLENFERAFGNSSAGCVRTCECGITYFDGVQSYDWEPGELERLEAQAEAPNAKAVRLEYAPGDMGFEGGQYVDACTCWHKRAGLIMGFIDAHAHKIAAYLKLEKARQQRIADAAPTV